MNSPSVLAPFKPGETVSSNGGNPPACRPEVMTITPEIAREWANLNTRNRSVRYTRVAQIARDMKAGKWMLNGETIKIAADGTILDGQHRIYACIQAEVSFETVVIRGLPMEAQDTIDTGAARQMGDQLSLKGEANPQLLAAIARWLFKWTHGSRARGTAEAEPTHGEMLAILERRPDLRDAAAWAAHARASFRSVNGSAYGMAWILFHDSNPAAADDFLEKVITGADISIGHPALAFRNRIWKAREAGEKIGSFDQLAYIILAWNAFREGRDLSRMQLPKGGLTPKNFPVPK